MTHRTRRNLKAYLLQKYGGHCQSCGIKTSIDHVGSYQTPPLNQAVVGLVVSKLRGGERTRENTVLLCRECQDERFFSGRDSYEYRPYKNG